MAEATASKKTKPALKTLADRLRNAAKELRASTLPDSLLNPVADIEAVAAELAAETGEEKKTGEEK